MVSLLASLPLILVAVVASPAERVRSLSLDRESMEKAETPTHTHQEKREGAG